MPQNKLNIWNPTQSWEEAERKWDEGAQQAKEQVALKGLKRLPKMVGITAGTKWLLRFKAFQWLLRNDHQGKIVRHFLAHPFSYTKRYIASLFSSRPYRVEGDFYYYGVKNREEFEELLQSPNTLLAVGFSYCHKPFECPSGRFTDACIHDPDHPICRQCFIGKAANACPTNDTRLLWIPTVNYVSEKMLDLVANHPDKKVLFLITACEMTLKMFADWGNMAGIRGIGVRLDGRICNTMQAFSLSEKGVKPGLTVVLPETQKAILELLRVRKEGGELPLPQLNAFRS